MEKKQELIKIAKKYELDFLILFGSRAKKTNRKNSDWDFAYFKLKNDINFDELYNEIWELFNFQDINLINLSENNSYILEEEIFKTGVKIYIKNKEIYFERRNQTFFNYNDYSIYDNNLLKTI